jgi:hypothetical protein
MARNCFVEVRLLSPQSSYARRARAQLQEMFLDEMQRAVDELRQHFISEQSLTDGDPQEAAAHWHAKFLKAVSEMYESHCASRGSCRSACSNQDQHATPGSPEYVTPEQWLERLQIKRAEQSRRMYHRGERHRLAGELDEALECYRVAHRLCPSSSFGQRAMNRVCEIEHRLMGSDEGIGEEQEPAPSEPPKDDEARTLEILRSSVPLEVYLENEGSVPTSRAEAKEGVDNYTYEVPVSEQWIFPENAIFWRQNDDGSFGSIVLCERGQSSPPMPRTLGEMLSRFCPTLDFDVSSTNGFRVALTVAGALWQLPVGAAALER